jgi:UDP-N-acetylglucosamine 1-carboxyvinyltransferase
MLQVFQKLGGSVTYLKGNSIRLCAKAMNNHIIDKELSKKERASMMFLGPLLHRFKRAEVGDAGGCKLGNRPIDTLFQGLVALGAIVNEQNIYQFTAKNLKANPFYWQLESSVTGTESFIMTAVLAKGTSVLYNAACEPHVQDLCNFLVSIGAKIEGIGSNKLTIEGVDKLQGGEWKVISDFIDIGGLIVAAAITGGELRIEDAIPEHMGLILGYFNKVNLVTRYEGKTLIVPKNQDLFCKPNLKGDMDKVPDQPWPTGFPVDLIPQMIILAAKAKGSIKIYSIMYETQLFFIEELLKMRAKVMLADTHTVVTFGPSEFRGANIVASNIIQSAHAQLLAALAAKGTSTINNSEIISRRYPDVIDTFRSLGANIVSER